MPRQETISFENLYFTMKIWHHNKTRQSYIADCAPSPEEDRAMTVDNMYQKFGSDRSVVRRYPLVEIGKEIHRHINHNTCAPLAGVYKAMNTSFVIPCSR